MTKDIIDSIVQKGAESDSASEAVKNLQGKAAKEDMSFLTYLTKTSPEMREIFDRMLLSKMQERKKTQELI